MAEVDFLTNNLEQDKIADDIQLIILNVPQNISLLKKLDRFI